MPEEEIISPKEKTKTKIITIGTIIGGIILIIVLISLGKVAYRAWFKPEISKPKEIERPREEIPEVLPEEEDFDSDGMLNGWERKYGLNPKDSGDALDDPDKDDLTNLQEFMYQVDPKNSDTDKDGYLDGQEVKAGYNPTGPGKLKEPLPKTIRLSLIEGKWSGIISGAIYSSNDVVFTLTSDGKLTGEFTFTIENKKAQNKVSGLFDFNDRISGFTAELESKITLDKTQGEYKLTLNGIVNQDKSEIIGTWTGYSEATDWLKKDRGTFKLTKTR